VIDATHPFAERMSANAEAACRAAGVPLAVFTRPPWRPQTGDRWSEVEGAAEAAQAIGMLPRRVFLTIGRLQLDAFSAAPRHDYLIRSIDPPEAPLTLPRHRLMLARGPFSLQDERGLMKREAIDFLVTKNSGGDASRAKLDAARELGLEVVLIRPPPRPTTRIFHDLDALVDFLTLRAHRALLGV
jgi:precorrin-6A/cobalt-precorrin-6A reductase